MKTKRLLILLITVLCLCISLRVDGALFSTSLKLSQQQLDEILGPVALYPDALVALILPASTVPNDVTQAALYVSAKGNPNQVGGQPWDNSVKSLTHYPDVLQWMSQNIDWTTQLGQAFLAQPAVVMETIQRLRGEAKAAGNLVDTPQQRIVEDQGNICIVPQNPDRIYVPQYDPGLVFVAQADYLGPFFSFGIGWPVGPWLTFGCNWPGNCICFGGWRGGWNYNNLAVNANLVSGQTWQVNPARANALAASAGAVQRNGVTRPSLMAGAPTRSAATAAATRAQGNRALGSSPSRAAASAPAPGNRTLSSSAITAASARARATAPSAATLRSNGSMTGTTASRGSGTSGWTHNAGNLTQSSHSSFASSSSPHSFAASQSHASSFSHNTASRQASPHFSSFASGGTHSGGSIGTASTHGGQSHAGGGGSQSHGKK